MGIRGRVAAGRNGRRIGFIAVTVATLALTAGTGAAAPTAAAVVAPDTVTVLSDPGTTLAVPVDGRVNGWRFAGHVLGVATGFELGAGQAFRRAAAGQRLWVFGLDIVGDTDSDGNLPPITSTLVVDGTRIAFPAIDSSPNASQAGTENSTFDTGNTYWLASVPAGASDVAVALAAGGYAQTFSLTRMAREGPQPTVLYRDPKSWQVKVPESGQKDLPTPDPTGYTSDTTFPVTFSGVTLSWFGPDHPSDTPSDPARAWLIPQINNLTYDQSGSGMCFPSLPGSDVTLATPGAQPQPATLFNGLGTDRPGFGAFTNGYAFQVPGVITAATLTVQPGTMSATTLNCSEPVTVTAQGSAAFPIAIDTPSYTPPAGASTTPALIKGPPGATAQVARATSGAGTDGFPFTLALIALTGAVALAVIGDAVRRRRRSTADQPLRALGDPPPAAPIEPSVAASTSPAPPHHLQPPAVAEQPVAPEPPTTVRPALSTLLDPPAGPPPLREGMIELQLLGPVRLIGLPPGTPPISQPALELLALLATHKGEPRSAEQLRDELGRGRERDLEVATIRRYINQLRQVLGDRIPESRLVGGYELRNVSLDIDRFDAFIKEADTSSTLREEAAQLASALALVRGVPFSDRPRGAYGWADVGNQLAAMLANRILSVSIRLATTAWDYGDADLAQWSARSGLYVSPEDKALMTLMTAGGVPKPRR